MTQEEKQILIKELCTRLPYEVICQCIDNNFTPQSIDYKLVSVNLQDETVIASNDVWNNEFYIEYIKPYLRPLSSMTGEEILELYKIAYDTWYSDSLYYKNEEWITFKDSIQNNALCFENRIWLSDIDKVIDWLNKKMFDYRRLIEKGLALEALEDMYNNK